MQNQHAINMDGNVMPPNHGHGMPMNQNNVITTQPRSAPMTQKFAAKRDAEEDKNTTCYESFMTSFGNCLGCLGAVTKSFYLFIYSFLLDPSIVLFPNSLQNS